MPLVSQSADQTQTQEQASAVWQANGHLKLQELISKTFRNRKNIRSSVSLFSFFAFRNLDSFEFCDLISLNFFSGIGIHLICVDFSLKFSPVPEPSTVILISACHLYWPHSIQANKHKCLIAPLQSHEDMSVRSKSSSRIPWAAFSPNIPASALTSVVQTSRLS